MINRKLACLLCLALAPGLVLAQPKITAVAPLSAPAGSTVTITGSNFEPIAVNNIVYFGAVRAPIVSGSTNSLTVTVPAGATYAPLTVTIPTGFTAYSVAPFVPTFTSPHSLTSNSFAEPLDFTTGLLPQSIVLADLDGDGKADIITPGGLMASVSVLRNTSTESGLSFATNADFATEASPQSVAVGDLDGDGQLDLAVANFDSDSLSVLRNTSVTGSISFAAQQTFLPGFAPAAIAIADLDGDGRPDLVVANYGSGTVSVFRNTSSIGAISFADPVDFATGLSPYSVAIADLDGDGKPDLVVANLDDNTVSVLRNMASAGAIDASSFASKVDFSTGQGPYSVAIGDLDGDGKPDLVVANSFGSSVSLFRNSSSLGSLDTNSFAIAVDLAMGDNPVGVALGDADGDGRLDLAVALLGTNVLFQNLSQPGSLSSNSFGPKIEFTAGSGSYAVALGDLDGDGKPELVFANANSTVSVLQNAIRFGPLYLAVQGGGGVNKSPDQAAYDYGDMVTLTATNARYYQFLAWSDGVTNTTRNVTLTAAAPNILTAIFTNTAPLETLSFKQWDRSFGGVAADNYPIVRSTPDGGCVVAGATASGISGNKTTPLCGAVAAWVVKLDADGNKQWEQTVGAPGSALYLNSIEVTGDGGYVLGASSTADVSPVTNNCGKISPNFGGYDFWLVRLDASGQRMWDASYGGSGLDALSAMAVLDDGGFVLAGVSDSPVSGNKTSPNFGGRDFWVVRVDASGNKLWDRSFGGSAADQALAVAVMADGGFLVSGGSSSGVSGNKTAPNYGLQDYWVVRLDADGNKLWDHSYGGSSDDNGAWMTPMPDGGAVLAGYTDSPINTGTRTATNWGGSDYWVVRIDANGNQLWDRSFGGSALYDWAYNVKAAADGGVIVVGESDSGIDGNKTSPQFGNSDGWVVRLDAHGQKVEDYSLGGTDYDYIWSVDTGPDNGFILAGGSFSDPSGNKTAPHWGDEDFWVVKMTERSAPVGAPVVLVNEQFHPDNASTATNSALIQLNSSLPGGKIYYTLNGAQPASGVLYTGLVVLTQPALVRAVAFSASFPAGVELDPVAVDIITPPFIITPPQARTVGEGADVSLSVQAGGTVPLSYQWALEGVPVPGATGPTLALPSIQPNQGGNYTVVITNAFGSITSAPVLVVVFAPPSIVAEPVGLIASVGDTVTFSVSALGPPPLVFQWRKNGANIDGATNTTFTITNVQFDDGSTYTVLVGSPGGTLLSGPALLVVNVPSPPAGDNFASTNTLVGANGAASGTNNFATREPGEPLHAGKPGSNSVWYAWTAPATGIATFRTTGSTFDTLLGIYTGTTVSNLATVAGDDDSGGFLTSKATFNATSGTTYHIAIDGLSGQQGSFVLRWDLLVIAAVVPEITCPPASLTVQPGQDAAFTVSATGPSLTYQWTFSGADIPGATQAAYTRTNVQPQDVGFYSVRLRSTAAQTVESAPAILEIGPDPGVQSKDKPNDVSASCPGALKARPFAGSAGASSVAMGSIGYQVLVSSSTNNLIDCNTTDCGGIPVGTRFLQLQPSASGTFVLDTMGSASRTKIWVCRAGTNNLDLTRTYVKCDVSSAPDGRSLVAFPAEAGRAYQIWISRLDNTNGVLQLNWKLGLPPLLTFLSPDLFAPAGASATLSVAATNVIDPGVTHPLSGPSFAWYFNGTALLATASSLALANLGANDAGQYLVVAINEVGATSAVVRVEVFGAAERALVNAGGFTELFADATTAGCDGAPARYQWLLNAIPLPGETNRNLYLNGTQPAQAGQYAVMVSNCFGAFTYAAATVAVTVDVGFTAELSGGGQVALRWQATPGKHYRVEQRSSFDATGWTPLQPDLTAISSTVTILDSIGSVPRFYRIVLLD